MIDFLLVGPVNQNKAQLFSLHGSLLSPGYSDHALLTGINRLGRLASGCLWTWKEGWRRQ